MGSPFFCLGARVAFRRTRACTGCQNCIGSESNHGLTAGCPALRGTSLSSSVISFREDVRESLYSRCQKLRPIGRKETVTPDSIRGPVRGFPPSRERRVASWLSTRRVNEH